MPIKIPDSLPATKQLRNEIIFVMSEKMATREAFGKALVELAESHDFVVMDADLSGSTKTGVFAKKFPDRFIE